MDAVVNNMELDTITKDYINQQVASLDLEIKKTDIHLPLTTKCIVDYCTWPWFSDSMKEQKRCVCIWENIWWKYTQDSMWTAFKTEWTITKMVNEAKKNYY